MRNPGQALVFVHGFNSTFEDALYRTAQLAHDLEFDGVPYLYSWPSKGEESGYLYDRDSADRAQRFFIEFLEADRPRDQGAEDPPHRPQPRQPAADGSAEGRRQSGAGCAKRLKLDQIVLAAPDIDRDVFVEIARAVNGSSRGTTLYASAQRQGAATVAHAGAGQPAGRRRAAGRPGRRRRRRDDRHHGGRHRAFLAINHNTYAEGGHVLADLRVLLRDGVHPPDRRFPVYRPMPSATGTWWKYIRN